MTEQESQKLSEVSETMLITLYLRAMESQRPDALIKDEKAVELVSQMNYDFSWTKRVPMSEVNKVTIILRNWEFDRYVRDFLRHFPEAVVVHIGCGLDTRFERVDNGHVHWYDLDLPEVIQLRKELIGTEAGRYHLLVCSVFDNQWLEVLSVHKCPFLFVAEGVSMYFDEGQVRRLFFLLRDNFPGAELVFDAFSPFHIWRSNLQIRFTKISDRFPRLCWGLWNGHEVESWGEGILLLDDWGYLDSSEPRLSFYRYIRHFPIAAKAGRIYHYRLGRTDQNKG
jgi:O-methyltransferase involved in polyketide biosynthesis